MTNNQTKLLDELKAKVSSLTADLNALEGFDKSSPEELEAICTALREVKQLIAKTQRVAGAKFKQANNRRIKTLKSNSGEGKLTIAQLQKENETLAARLSVLEKERSGDQSTEK